MTLLPEAHAAFIATEKNKSTLNLRSAFSAHLPPNLRHNLLIDQQRFMPCLMASVACNDGRVSVLRELESNTKEYSLFHRTFRPMSLSSRQAAPILVIHGGPGVPSDYLFPLVDFVPYRSIVYYDQLGCGRSDAPSDPSLYSIEKSLDDLETLINKLGLRRFHLYGQSFGGILAYELVKRKTERNSNNFEILSVILSGTPTSVPMVEDEANSLIERIQEKYDIDVDDDKSGGESLGELFRKEHQCRTPSMPIPLQDSYAHAGQPGIWRGTTSIQNYVATPPQQQKEDPPMKRMPSAMILRGEHDFVSERCIESWKSGGLFNHKFVRVKVLQNCSHHALLESGKEYGKHIDSFCSEYD